MSELKVEPLQFIEIYLIPANEQNTDRRWFWIKQVCFWMYDRPTEVLTQHSSLFEVKSHPHPIIKKKIFLFFTIIEWQNILISRGVGVISCFLHCLSEMNKINKKEESKGPNNDRLQCGWEWSVRASLPRIHTPTPRIHTSTPRASWSTCAPACLWGVANNLL